PLETAPGDRHVAEPCLPETEVDESAVAERAAVDDRVVDAGHRLEPEGDALERVRTHLGLVDGQWIEVDVDEGAVLHQPATEHPATDRQPELGVHDRHATHGADLELEPFREPEVDDPVSPAAPQVLGDG